MTDKPPFACPIHKVCLSSDLYCIACGQSFPSVGGIPILINDANSVFHIADYTSQEAAYCSARSYAGYLDRRSGLRQCYRRFMHYLAESDSASRSFCADDAIQHIHQHLPDARILVIGAGDRTYDGNVTYSDVAYGKNVSCIADAHDLPFEDDAFDACIAVAVLEHVADPQRCISEIERVLKPSAFVYSETPFMQPVHMGAYDFTRFTYLGHRRLFRRFDEIQSGMLGGPATSTSQIIRSLLVSLTDRRLPRKWLRMTGLLATYPLRLLDLVTRNRLVAYDSASGFYFFGTRRDTAISDREMLKYYRGG